MNNSNKTLIIDGIIMYSPETIDSNRPGNLITLYSEGKDNDKMEQFKLLTG